MTFDEEFPYVIDKYDDVIHKYDEVLIEHICEFASKAVSARL